MSAAPDIMSRLYAAYGESESAPHFRWTVDGTGRVLEIALGEKMIRLTAHEALALRECITRALPHLPSTNSQLPTPARPVRAPRHVLPSLPTSSF